MISLVRALLSGGDRRDIEQLHRRVRRAFKKDRVGWFAQRLLPRRSVRAHDGFYLDAILGHQHRADIIAGAEKGF